MLYQQFMYSPCYFVIYMFPLNIQKLILSHIFTLQFPLVTVFINVFKDISFNKFLESDS